jgi:hypothetical protein
MDSSAKGPEREEAYREALRKADIGVAPTGKVVQSPDSEQNRQVDVVVTPVEDGPNPRILIQVKAGDEHLSMTDPVSGGKQGKRGARSHSKNDALEIDGEFTGREHVIWVFEGQASGPLVQKAISEGVKVVALPTGWQKICW